MFQSRRHGSCSSPSSACCLIGWGALWLLIAAVFVLCVFYGLVRTPEQLFLIRIIHGIATAIYGPVTYAYIAERLPEKVAASLGWFGLARSGGYILGPALAGWMLLSVDPAVIFTVIGLLSMLALLPMLRLPEPEMRRQREFPPLLAQTPPRLRSSATGSAVGGLEAAYSSRFIRSRRFCRSMGCRQASASR